MVTVWNRATGESFIVTATPNPQGWRLAPISESTDLRSVAATIAAADQQMTLRFDPDRLTPPKLDNQSKPAPRNEGALIVEALLRALDPVAARAFETLPAEAQEKFRKSFTEFLAAYPTASDEKRIGLHPALALDRPRARGRARRPRCQIAGESRSERPADRHGRAGGTSRG